MRTSSCSGCGASVEGEHVPPSPRCEACGATSSWVLIVDLEDSVEMRERLEVMDGPSKRASRFRMESKDDFDRDAQRPSIAERTYDKDRDLYREVILVEGKVKLVKEERLSEHRPSSDRRGGSTPSSAR